MRVASVAGLFVSSPRPLLAISFLRTHHVPQRKAEYGSGRLAGEEAISDQGVDVGVEIEVFAEGLRHPLMRIFSCIHYG
jgi:hypothetical protein